MSVHPWGRFEVDGDRIPAADGHSIAVELEDRWGAILDQLSYATAPAAVDSLPRVGIHQMERQSVHLPGSFETARAVGAWHAGQPAVFLIEAGGLVEAAHPITKRGASVYPTSHVPRQA